MSKIHHQDIKALVDLSKPSLKGLSFILRNKEFWPKGFLWQFNNCYSCAMGLLAKLYGEVPVGSSSYTYDYFGYAMTHTGLNHHDAYDLFNRNPSPKDAYGLPTVQWDAVTPEMIADKIDTIIAQKEAA